jgi:hypothetical protein
VALAVVLGLLGVGAVLRAPDLGRAALLAPLASLIVGIAVFWSPHRLGRTHGCGYWER